MKMEAVLEELRNWGEIMITTAAGQTYELHFGDTEFDMDARVIRLKGAHAVYVISGDAVESVKKHFGHEVTGDH
jgi:hypothetical protein